MAHHHQRGPPIGPDTRDERDVQHGEVYIDDSTPAAAGRPGRNRFRAGASFQGRDRSQDDAFFRPEEASLHRPDRVLPGPRWRVASAASRAMAHKPAAAPYVPGGWSRAFRAKLKRSSAQPQTPTEFGHEASYDQHPDTQASEDNISVAQDQQTPDEQHPQIPEEKTLQEKTRYQSPGSFEEYQPDESPESLQKLTLANLRETSEQEVQTEPVSQSKILHLCSEAPLLMNKKSVGTEKDW